MRIDRTRTETAKARTIARRTDRRIASARRFLALAFGDQPQTAPAL
jgi:hypothetical protein